MEAKKFFLFLLILTFFLSLNSNAQSTIIQDIKNAALDISCMVLQILFYVSSGVAALFIVLGGLKWLSSDSPEGRQEGKLRVVYALVGLSIIIISCQVVNYIIQNTSIEPIPSGCCPLL